MFQPPNPPDPPEDTRLPGDVIDDMAAEIERLRAENEALKYSLQLDEELIGMIQKIISALNCRPAPNVEFSGSGKRSLHESAGTQG